MPTYHTPQFSCWCRCCQIRLLPYVWCISLPACVLCFITTQFRAFRLIRVTSVQGSLSAHGAPGEIPQSPNSTCIVCVCVSFRCPVKLNNLIPCHSDSSDSLLSVTQPLLLLSSFTYTHPYELDQILPVWAALHYRDKRNAKCVEWSGVGGYQLNSTLMWITYCDVHCQKT